MTQESPHAEPSADHVFALTGVDMHLSRDGTDLVLHFAEPASDGREIHVTVHGVEKPAASALATLSRGSSLRIPTGSLPPRPVLAVARGSEAPRRVAERKLPLDGALNFRDLGGYVTEDGRRVRWGRVFRADAPHSLSEADLALLRELGLGRVWDFRADEEKAEEPSRFAGRPDIELIELAISDGSMQPRNIRARFEAGELDGFDERFLARGYQSLLENQRPAFTRVLRDLAHADAPPGVFHCSAGKDRTGVMAALLLRLLGVPDETVVGDYALTTHYTGARIAQARRHAEARGADPERVMFLMTSPAFLMRETLAHIDETYGGVPTYLESHCELPADLLAAIRANLLE